jgi:hypothetical protein
MAVPYILMLFLRIYRIRTYCWWMDLLETGYEVLAVGLHCLVFLNGVRRISGLE